MKHVIGLTMLLMSMYALQANQLQEPWTEINTVEHLENKRGDTVIKVAGWLGLGLSVGAPIVCAYQGAGYDSLWPLMGVIPSVAAILRKSRCSRNTLMNNRLQNHSVEKGYGSIQNSSGNN